MNVALTTALLFRLQEEGHHAEKFLGISLPIWQLLNLVLFLAVLVYFVAKPMSTAFRNRQLEVEKRTREASRARSKSGRSASSARSRRSGGRELPTARPRATSS